MDLLLNTTTIPKQIIVIVPHGGTGKSLNLPFNTSILIYADAKSIPNEMNKVKNINVMTLTYALCKVSATYFKANPSDAEIALRSIKDSSELSQILIKYDFKAAASRLIGAYLFLKNKQMAKNIQNDLILYGIHIKQSNPFEIKIPYIQQTKSISAHADRILSLWAKYRTDVIDIFPSPGKKVSSLVKIQDLYEQDAYNSLSIEGYFVTPELIKESEQKKFFSIELNALAAKGYFEAFQEAKKAISKIIKGQNPGEIFKEDLQTWYQSLFSPSVKNNTISRKELLGYRKNQVYIRNSRHVPLPMEALLDAMDALFTCLINEPNTAVRAVLGHYIFVFIHPYSDGNGRIARLLMNMMLVTGKYPWTVVKLQNRNEYMVSLERITVEQNIIPFAEFLKKELSESLSLQG